MSALLSPRRAVIIDDEPPARRRIVQLLAAHPEVTVVGQGATVDDAVSLVASTDPDLLFLDVQLASGTSFSLFDRGSVRCAVIFVTAYAEHALRAFEVNALDYLMKPVDPVRLAAALARTQVRATPEQQFIASDTVALRTTRGFRFVALAEVVAIAADGDYSEVVLRDGERHLSDARMLSWSERLTDEFVRVHRAHIVRVSAIESFERRANGWELRVVGIDAAIPVGRTWVEAVRQRLGLRAAGGLSET